MRSDLITCVILIPFTIGIIYICLFAADYYNRRRFASMPIARWTSVSVLIMGITITFGFVVWIYLVFRYHCRVWYFWWQRETVVRLLNLKNCKPNWILILIKLLILAIRNIVLFIYLYTVIYIVLLLIILLLLNLHSYNYTFFFISSTCLKIVLK